MSYNRKRSIVAIVQARMGSKRIPGKVLMDIAGKPMVRFIIDRLQISQFIDNVVLAITVSKSDDTLARYLDDEKVPYYRGSENDIVERFYKAAQKFDADTVVRVWGDCPLIDASLIDIMIKEYFDKKADYATNGNPATYPLGMDAEIYSLGTLKYIFNNTDDPFYREFPFKYIQDMSSKFKIANIIYKKDVSDIKLTVDYPQDAKVILEIINYFSSTGKPLQLDNIVKFCENNKEIFYKTKELARNVEYKESLRLRETRKE